MPNVHDADSDAGAPLAGKPIPDVRDFRYGPHFGNSFDLYLAGGEGPAPLLVWSHGGSYLHGDKAGVPLSLLREALSAGISVASVNYRLTQQAPFPAPFHDVGRAVQYLRFDAGRWRIDPAKIVCAGSSAGGAISLWLAMHPDLADPDSPDLIACQPSQPNLITCIDAQCSCDPHVIGRVIPGPAAHGRSKRMLFRVRLEDFDAPWARERFAEGSAIDFASAKCPPAYLFYRYRDIRPTDDLPEGHAIHHPLFGHVLKQRLDELGVECIVSGADTHPDQDDAQLRRTFAQEAVGFIRRHWPAGK